MKRKKEAVKTLHVLKRIDMAGGAERIVADLVRTNPDFDVLVFGGGESFFPLGKEPMRAKNILHAMWVCLSLSRSYSTFHLHLFPAIYFSLILGRNSIIHEHSTHNRRRDLWYFKIIERFVYARARQIIAISLAVEYSLSRWIGCKDKITVLPNFVTPFAADIHEKEPEIYDRKNILMVARFTSAKRQDLLIEALKYLPKEMYLTLIGDGEHLNRCKELASTLNVAGRVEFLGSISDVVPHYRRADVCVLVSHWEGFGLVALEAAQLGKACIVSDIEGLREVCPDPRLLLQDNSPLGLAEKIIDVASFSRGEEFRKKVISYSDQFNIKNYTKSLKDIYLK